jgi:hypothetical protein
LEGGQGGGSGWNVPVQGRVVVGIGGRCWKVLGDGGKPGGCRGLMVVRLG